MPGKTHTLGAGLVACLLLVQALEPISQMAKQDDRTRQVKEAGKVRAAALVARDEAPRVLEPGEEALDSPAAFVAPERAAVLGQIDAIASMRRNQLDVVRGEGAVERVAVIGRVPDEPRGVVGEEAGIQRRFDERDFVRRGRGDSNGDRKTSAVCNGHDLGALAALRLADVPPFFLALANEPSMNVSLRSRPPRAWRSRASAFSTCLSVPWSTQR